MKKAFVIYGTTICLIFAYASFSGMNITDSVKSGNWGPKGHTAYHK